MSDAFAIVLQRRRVLREFSKNVLAQRAGLDQTHIGLIERGKRNPTLDTAAALATALGIPLSDLIEECEAIQEKTAKVRKRV